MLDDAGFTEVQIFASSGFDEYKIADVLNRGARIDAFGVGTSMGVSADAPYLDIVYKLVRFDGRDVRKKSTGKETLAGEKQVFRRVSAEGRFEADVIGVPGERIDAGTPLLGERMAGGRLQGRAPELEDIRRRVSDGLGALPADCRRLDRKYRYPVRVSDRLAKVQAAVDSLNR
jgi:nicotinate phosphoribosyltransferase